MQGKQTYYAKILRLLTCSAKGYMMNNPLNQSDNNSHSIIMGYVMWIFGFMGAHRFYYGKRATGVLYFCTLGLFFIGWLVDLFLIPGMDEEADMRFQSGRLDYNLTWILLAFTGALGFHRFYMGKYITAVLMLLVSASFITGVLAIFLAPVLLLVLLYDYFTLNQQISEINQLDAA